MLDKNLILKGPSGNYSIPEGCSLGKFLVDCMRKRNPNDIFCIDGITGKSLTCGEILDLILKTVVVLRKLGIQKGDVVAIISENCIKYCFTLLACFYVGAATNLINPAYTTGELQRVLNITKPKIILSSKDPFQKICEMDKMEFPLSQIVLLEEVPKSDMINSTTCILLDEALEGANINSRKPEPANIDGKTETITIFLSSGTTGLPKCLMLTHENSKFSSEIFGNPDFVGIKSGDSTIAILPFFHIFGCSTIYVAAMHCMKLVIMPFFQPEVFLKCIQTYRITLLYAVPTIVSFLAKHPVVTTCDLSSIKFILCAGGNLGIDNKTEFNQRHPNIHIVDMYGLTEFSGAAIINPRHVLSKPESVGTLIPDAQALIWDENLGKNLGPLKTGELCLRGPQVMKGYIDGNSNDIDKNGFYHTGDLFYYDEDGYFYIVGRIKELIKFKGYQVAPVEIENIVMKHKAVAECAVVGIPDERAGQLATACIVLKPEANASETEIVDFVAEKISVQKHLYGGVRFMESLPKNATGKVLRNKLLELCSTL